MSHKILFKRVDPTTTDVSGIAVGEACMVNNIPFTKDLAGEIFSPASSQVDRGQHLQFGFGNAGFKLMKPADGFTKFGFGTSFTVSNPSVFRYFKDKNNKQPNCFQISPNTYGGLKTISMDRGFYKIIYEGSVKLPSFGADSYVLGYLKVTALSDGTVLSRDGVGDFIGSSAVTKILKRTTFVNISEKAEITMEFRAYTADCNFDGHDVQVTRVADYLGV